MIAICEWSRLFRVRWEFGCKRTPAASLARLPVVCTRGSYNCSTDHVDLRPRLDVERRGWRRRGVLLSRWRNLARVGEAAASKLCAGMALIVVLQVAEKVTYHTKSVNVEASCVPRWPANWPGAPMMAYYPRR